MTGISLGGIRSKVFLFNATEVGNTMREGATRWPLVGTDIMAPRVDIGDNNKSSGTPAAIAPRLGHRIREIRRQVDHRHHALGRYQGAHTGPHPPDRPAGLLSVTSDEYRTLLYTRCRGTDPRERLSAVREATQRCC